MSEIYYEYKNYTTNQAMNIMHTAERDVCERLKEHNNKEAVNIAEVAFKIGAIMSSARSNLYALLKAEEDKSYEAKEARRKECVTEESK